MIVNPFAHLNIFSAGSLESTVTLWKYLMADSHESGARMPRKDFFSSLWSKPDQGINEETLNWKLACRKVTSDLSTDWFKDQDTTTARGILGEDFPGSIFMYSLLWPFLFTDESGESDKVYLKNLKSDRENFGRQINISDSVFFDLLRKDLLSHVDVGDSVALLSSSSHRDSKYLQFLEVFENEEGEELYFFSFQGLIASRSLSGSVTATVSDEEATEEDEEDSWIFEIPENEIINGALTFGECSISLHIPLLAKDLFYLAETPFPSAIFSSERTIAFPGVQKELLPTPVLVAEEDANVYFAKFDSSSGNHTFESEDFPWTVSFGYTFSAPTYSFLENLILRLSDVFDGMVSILEDGYQNYRHFSDIAPFHVVVGSEIALSQENRDSGVSNGESGWIPISNLGEEVTKTEENYFRARNLSNKSEQIVLYEQVRMIGVGHLVTHAINSLVFNSLIPQKKWDVAINYLSQAIGMPDKESYNATSNLGVVYFLSGDLEQAQSIFSSLERIAENLEPHVVAEIYYYLGLIAKSQSRQADALKYFRLCGSFSSSEYSKLALTELPQELSDAIGLIGLIDEASEFLEDKSTPSLSSETVSGYRFCTQCGQQVEKKQALFCGNCGEKL